MLIRGSRNAIQMRAIGGSHSARKWIANLRGKIEKSARKSLATDRIWLVFGPQNSDQNAVNCFTSPNPFQLIKVRKHCVIGFGYFPVK